MCVYVCVCFCMSTAQFPCKLSSKKRSRESESDDEREREESVCSEKILCVQMSTILYLYKRFWPALACTFLSEHVILR